MEKQFLLLFLTAIIFFVSLLGRFFFLKMRTYLINKNPNKKTYRIKEHDKRNR
jgi:cell division protein FtsL